MATRRQWMPRALLALAMIAVYANSFGNGFHFDDSHAVVDNPAIRSLRNVPRFFTDTTTFSVLPANRTYRPAVSTMLAVDYALGRGYKPFWFHLSTFVLFVGLALLLVEIYKLLMDAAESGRANEWLALFAAAWFALHPAMAETVNYVIQRGDLYCTLGCVAALYFYARWSKLRRWGLYLPPFVLAMLSKPPAAVFPLLLLFYVYFFENTGTTPGTRWKKAGLAVVPSLAVTAMLLWLQAAMTPKSFAPTLLSAADYCLTQPYVWLRYCAALMLPIHLNVDSDLGAFNSWNVEAVAGVVFVLGLLSAIAVTARQRRLYPVAFGLLWFAITQLPTSLYPLAEVENDHRMFFSFVGLILAAVWGAWRLWRRYVPEGIRAAWRPAVTVAALLVLAAYGYGTVQRNRVWRSEETLWLDDTQKSPKNGRGLMNYALTQMALARYPVALDYLTRALMYTPDYATLEINLGVVNGAMADQGDTGRSAEAERHFLRAIALAPADDNTHAFYGRWLDQHGRTQEAIEQLTTAVALDPQRPMQHDLLIQAELHAGDLSAARRVAEETLTAVPGDLLALSVTHGGYAPDASTWINLSLAQYQQAQYEQAIASARKALEIDPKSAVAYNNIAASYAGLRQFGQAVENAQQAVRLDPSLQIAANNLALYTRERDSPPPVTATAAAGKTADDYLNDSLHLYQAGKYNESVAAARSALKLRPNFPEAWNNIAAAEASQHRWDDAIAAAQKAIALKPDFQLAKNNLAWATSEKAKQR